MYKSLWAILLLAIATPPVLAVDVPALYTAQVPMDQRKNDPRAHAYKAALDEVLLRVSGADLVADAGRVELLFPDPGAYVVEFRPGEDDTLWVSFDGDAIESVLRRSGQTVWGGDRPLTLVWLAVDWGGGEREIIGADDPERTRDAARSIDRNRLLRERVLDIAQRRGLPLIFPLLDAEDLQMVRFSDIWGGFDEAMLEASARYEANSILVGRVRAGSGERNQWRYYFGEQQRIWNGEPELVVSQIAQLLADEFSIGGSERLEAVALTVGGINSVNAYGAMQALLSGISVVESFAVTEVEGDRILYRVEAHGGTERLRRALRFNGLIEQNGIDSLNPNLEFFYSP